MIASPTLHLILAASLAASPAADPSTCAPSDHRCTAEANVVAARAAISDNERVHRLYRAHRAYLALARRAAPDERARPLCRAADLLGQVRVLRSPESLRQSLVDTTKETTDALENAGIDCSPPKKHRKEIGRRLATRPSPSTTTPPATDGLNPSSASEPAPVLLGVRARRPAATHAVAPSPAPRPEQFEQPVAAATRDDEQRKLASQLPAAIMPPGRRLLIGGGVAMAAGVVLGGAAAYLGTRASHARQAGMDLAATQTGAAAREQGLALQDEYRNYGTIAVAGAVVGGAAVLAGVVMLVVGHHRNTRTREREALILPARTGLLLSVKF